MQTQTLDIGCGDRGLGDVNIDLVRTKDCDLVGDACFLPFRDECFKSVSAWALLEHLEDPRGGLREIMRVLKTNGTALLVFPKPLFTNIHIGHLVRFILSLPITILPTRIYREIVCLRNQKRLGMRHKSIITRAFIEQQSKRLGFEITEFIEIENLVLFYYPRRRWRIARLIFKFKPKLYSTHRAVCRKLA